MDTERWLKWIPAIGALLVALILLAIFIFRQVPNDWSSVVALVAIAIFIFVVAFTLHFAIRDPVEWFTDNEARLRGKLAPLVVGIGTVGILVVAGGVTCGIQAVIAAGATSGSSSDAEPVTSPARMISVEKITSITLGGPKPSAASKTVDTNAPAAHSTAAPQLYPARFEDVLLVDVANLLGNTVTRVVVFEKHRAVKAVLRGRLIPAHVAGDTVQKYLDHEGNRSDAFNFNMLPETATIGDARAMARVFKLADIFITKTGQKDEPIKGWLPDDRLL